MAKVLFVNLYEPDYLGTRYLASYLLKHGHTPHILSLKLGNGKNLAEEREEHLGYMLCVQGYVRLSRQDINPITEQEFELFAKAIKDFSPEIVAISARSMHKNLLTKLIPLVRQTPALLLTGGFGPSLETEEFLSFGIDVVARGEGEETLLDIANAIDNKQGIDDIQNCSFMTDGIIKHNPMRPQEKDLSLYPPPLYGKEYCSYIESDTHENKDYSEERTVYLTLLGRGCVGTCSYCCAGQWYKQYKDDGHKFFKRRNREFDDVFEELKNIDKTIYKYIVFSDEMFSIPAKQLLEFFDRYKKEVNLPFFIYMDYSQCLNEPLILEKAFDAGWFTTGIGFQSGSKEIVQKYYQRADKRKEYIEYAKVLFDNYVSAEIHNLAGNCYETEEHFQENLDYIKQMPFDITNPFRNELITLRLKPLSKTPLLEIAPKVLTDPMPAKLWLYRAALANLRRIMNDKDFEEIRKVDSYKENPASLLTFYRELQHSMQLEYLKNFTKQHKGKNLIFYGAGDIYQNQKQHFAECKPIAMLLDENYINDKTHIDGIPIVPMSKIHELDSSCPIVIFSQRMSTLMCLRLKRFHNIAQERIYTLTFRDDNQLDGDVALL